MDTTLPWNDTAGFRKAARLYRIPLTAEMTRAVDINVVPLFTNPFDGYFF
jgi:hypothetical protein